MDILVNLDTFNFNTVCSITTMLQRNGFSVSGVGWGVGGVLSKFVF